MKGLQETMSAGPAATAPDGAVRPAGRLAGLSARLADLRVVDNEVGKSKPSTRVHSTKNSMQLHQ